MTTNNSIPVLAKKWAHGWELIIDEHNATQVRTLAHARSQVIDYLDTLEPEIDHSSLDIRLVFEDVQEELQQARAAQQAAREAEQEAALKIRLVVAKLREEKGLSLADTAAVVGVTKGRVQQLQAS